jgi:leucyl aminopeptidase (aminopeptidase T)
MTNPAGGNGTRVPARHTLSNLDRSYAAEFVEGAHNAIFTCLDVRESERAVLITDLANREIGASLADQFLAAGARLEAFVIEDIAQRPLTDLPQRLADALETAQVSCYAASAQTGELTARITMTKIVNRRGIRHAHMVNLTPRIMREGMRADFLRVDALSRWVLDRVRPASTLEARSRSGSDLRVRFDPSLRWIKTSGLITPEKWGNLPGGEVFTCPARIDGVFVCDGVLGDWLAPKYGDMRAHPMRVWLEDSRIVDLSCDRQEIVDDFRAYTSQHANSNRVGEFALGTNFAVKEIIGQILQDEKFPGVHIAFGHPYSEHTGADWAAPSHIDIVGRDFDVDVDGEPIMRESCYLLGEAELERYRATVAVRGGNGSGGPRAGAERAPAGRSPANPARAAER